MQTSHPGIAVESITDTRSLSLALREADIAIRLAPFEQHAAVVSHIADMAFGLYAADAYLAAHGTPDLAVEGGAGFGLAALPRYLADAVVGLRLLPTAVTPPVREVWLGVHKDMRATPRIRAVLEAVTTGIRAQARALSPRAGAHDQGQGR